ncbi:unnamed protein product [Oikopleura dioica]|uniref:Vacuolar protein-sorting-associated protein 36 n=1 Tax=Oikopleura dioica TaxID=34765 RepID=E4WW56_OIKDI|nr:unnamed protein product [Oikopleura dioica]
MNRWCYFEGALDPAEKIHGQCTGCRLYDGDVKTNYKDGTISISSHKITFHGEKVTLFIPMRLIISANCVAGSWNHFSKSGALRATMGAVPEATWTAINKPLE